MPKEIKQQRSEEASCNADVGTPSGTFLCPQKAIEIHQKKKKKNRANVDQNLPALPFPLGPYRR